MKTIKTLIFIFLFGMNFTFSQYFIPSCVFNSTADVNNWSITPTTISKTWFNGGCLAMFVDNLADSPPTTITSPAFYLGSMGSYELEVRYSVIYSSGTAIFELLNTTTNTVMSPSSTITTAGICTSWPNPKISKLNYASLPLGNYKLKVTIPGHTQFFLEGVRSNVDYSALNINETSTHFVNSIAPNPTKDKIYFKDIKNISKVNIFDAQGRLVKTSLSKDNYTDLSSLNKGIYILEIFSDGKSYKTKVVKE